MTLPLDKAAMEAAMDALDLDQEGRDAVARLDAQDVAMIDQAILSALGRDWKKAGFITAGVMIAAPDAHEEIPELFYAYRIRALVQASRIEGRGDPFALKTFEIRLAAQDAS